MNFENGRTRRLARVLAWCLCGLIVSAPAQAARKHRHPKKRPHMLRMAMSKPKPVPASPVDPEVLLLYIYKTLRIGRLADAEAQANALVAAYPNFALGQMLRGDLLLMHHDPVNSLAGMNSTLSNVATAAGTKDLRDEAAKRLAALTERPNPDLLPRSILNLANDQKFALLVDASRSRMYLYKNTDSRLELVKDFYISQGKLGVKKEREGDKKTPLGVYHVVTRIEPKNLSDFYGSGALPISYPNDWDRLQGRTGHGIWLHGTPSDTFSRAPRSSDGCVVMTNRDMSQLVDTVDVNNTPVIISDREEFITKEKWAAERTRALMLVEQWRQDAEIMPLQRLRSRYAKAFKSADGESADDWLKKTQATLSGPGKVQIGVSELEAFDYPGQSNLVAISFLQTLTSGKTKQTVRRRQYWTVEDNQWRIVSESIIERPRT
ncbi:L,D-transpeptidase family protein [Noviherbaspirillum pedocola]|uniref:L,D-transpeptidase family protein n=1 Tax=Noviherbaspirillum pedocola TaxID=2801341 RepID=A0A934W782_9BURK|nr:L,D-transpeptidase family protein [Noviherbaspirillum pedocola]MBK4736060.1 L,D-transpeptidase family protein [Noviherbaspirillum pedocola]